MICSNCSQQPALSALSLTRPSTVIFPVPAGPGREETLAWPSIARLSVANTSTNQESPSLIGKRSVDQWVSRICRYWLEVGIVVRCNQGHQPLLKQFRNASNIRFTINCQNVNHYWESNGNWMFCSTFHVMMNAEMLREIHNKMFSSRWYCSNWLIHQDSRHPEPTLYWIPTKQLEKVSSSSQDMLPISELI